jgi:ABC-type amino acid transport substrate-binding protein
MSRIFTLVLFVLSSIIQAQTVDLKLSSDVWPPFTNVESKKSIALDIVSEALKRVDIKTGYEIVDFEQVILGIQDGTYDGSAALWYNSERDQYLEFSKPYLQNQLILVGRKGSNVQIFSFSSLNGKKIGVVEDYAYGDSLMKREGIQIVYGKSDQQNVESLLSKRVDYILVDALLLQYLFNYQMNDVSEFLEIGEKPLLTKSLHFALRKKIPNAAKIIALFNNEISEMISDGTYHDILELNWIRADIDGDGELELVLKGNKAGEEAPDHTYNVFYSEENKDSNRYYINGKVYQGWDNVPEKSKISIPKLKAYPTPGYGGIKF